MSIFDSDGVDSDDSIGASNIESSRVGAPGDGSGLGDQGGSFLSFFSGLGVDLTELLLVFLGQIPDLDGVVASGGDPLEVGVESQSVDVTVGLESESGLGHVGEVPDLDFLVFSSGGDVLAVLGEGKGVDGVLMGSD